MGMIFFLSLIFAGVSALACVTLAIMAFIYPKRHPDKKIWGVVLGIGCIIAFCFFGVCIWLAVGIYDAASGIFP